MQATPPSVFVTGATGFIGQRLVSTLVEQRFHVRAMVRPGTETDTRLPSAIEQIPVGLTDADKLAGIVAKSSAVIYCAGSVRGRSAEDFSVANIDGVRAMLDALERTADAPPMLLISSLAASQPGLSDYAQSKYQGEQLLFGKSSLPWTIIRPPAVYGPGDTEMLPVLKMIRRGLLAHAGSRDQRLSLLHVDDLVAAIMVWLSEPHRYSQKTYSIDDGTPGGYDWAAIGEAVSDGNFLTIKLPRMLLDITAGSNTLISSLLGYAPMLTPGKVRELTHPEWLCDNTAFSAVSGWKPKLNLKEGARKLFAQES